MTFDNGVQGEDVVHEPLIPIYPFVPAGEPITVYDGPMGGFVDGVDVHGIVQLRCAPRIGVVWHLKEGDSLPVFSRLEIGDVDVVLHLPRGDHCFPVHRRRFDRGWSNGVKIGSTEAPLDRVVAHWLNLPQLRSSIRISGGSESEWTQGRWVANLSGWKVTLDRRPDHSRIWAEAKEMESIAVTHVMEIRRDDGRSFTAKEVKPVLTALQYSLSFALGRWVAPALPVGIDNQGDIVWQEWGPSHCSPAELMVCSGGTMKGKESVIT